MNKHTSLKRTIYAALLTSISVVLKVFLGIPVNLFGGFVKDINLSPTVIMFSGMSLGPWYGAAIGAITDVLVYLVRPLGSYNPIFTITNALIGLIPALFFLKSPRRTLWRISLSTSVTQTLCSFVINTLALILLGFMPAKIAWFRALSTFVMLPLHIFLIYMLTRASEKYLPFLVSPDRTVSHERA